MRLSIIIPWQDRGDPDFRRAAEFVIDHYRNLGIGEVVVGTYPYTGETLNRSRLRNEGAKLATGDVLLFIDAELLIPTGQLLEAARLAEEAPGPVLPFSQVWTYPTPEETRRIYDGEPFEQFIRDEPRRSYLYQGRILRHWFVGPASAITRSGYDTIGGWDEDFVGWGEEDRIFNWNAHWRLGPLRVVDGGYLHLNHTQDTEKTDNAVYYTEGTPERRQYLANVELFRRKALAVRSPRIVVYSATGDSDTDPTDWAASAADADEVHLLAPPGSRTADRARALGVTVLERTVDPWRIDTALNLCLEELPDADMYFAVHPDERIRGGWRSSVDVAWLNGYEGLAVSFDWYEDITFTTERIHEGKTFTWNYPAFPRLVPQGGHLFGAVPGIVVERHPDDGNEDQYPEEAVAALLEERPDDPYALYWAARYYYRLGRWDQGREAAMAVLSCSTNQQMKSDAALLVADMVWDRERERWLLRAASEEPSRREPWERLADHYMMHRMGHEAAAAVQRCLRIKPEPGVNDWSRSKPVWDDQAIMKRYAELFQKPPRKR